MTANVKFSQLPNLTSITANTIIPVVVAGTNYTVTTANLQTYVNGGAGNISSGNITATGSISAGGNVLGGNVLTGGTISGTGNITGGNILTGGRVSAAGNVTGAYIFGNGSQLTGLPATYTNSNVTTLLAAFGSNTVSTTGNVTAGYFIGNGSQLTGLGNITGTISATGNITGGNILTSGLVSATGNVSGNYLRAAQDINAGGNVSAVSHTGASVSVTGNVTGGNIRTVGSVSATGNITGGNIITAGVFNPVSISTSGNITGNYLLGNGRQLTGVISSYGDSNVTTLMGNFGSNSISSSGTISCLDIQAPSGTVTSTFVNTAYLTTVDFTSTAQANLTTLNSYGEKVGTVGNTGTSFTPAYANGIIQNVTANNNFTLNAFTLTAGQSVTLVITQDATGNRVMTPNSQYKFAGGVNTLSTTANAIDMLSIFYNGSTYLCNLAKGYS